MLQSMISRLELLIVHVKEGSVGLSMVPDSSNITPSLFSKSTVDWHKNIFTDYKRDVVLPDYSMADVQRLSGKFTPEERKKIYMPYFAAVGGDEKKPVCRVNLYDLDTNRDVKILSAPDKKIRKVLTPQIKTVKTTEEVDGIFLGHIKKDGTETKVSDVYCIIDPIAAVPIRIPSVSCGKNTYLFSTPITAHIRQEQNTWFIAFEPLSIEVWGETVKMAQDAFAYAIDSLYTNYVMEDINKLSPRAVELRTKLQAMISPVKKI
jgi:hypothetical protein